MRRMTYLLLVASVLMVLPPPSRSQASPLIPQAVTTAAGSDVQPVYERRVYVGPRGGAAVVGPRGGVAVGPRGNVVVGSRYYGGVWYGTGRRYWGGRWWDYGVGRCWAPSPIGYVWICG